MKSLEDELKEAYLNVEQLTDRLKILREEVAAKNELISDKFTIKLPVDQDDPGLARKLFNASSNRIEFLEKQLVLSKKASLAHQTHNAFLSMEVRRNNNNTDTDNASDDNLDWCGCCCCGCCVRVWSKIRRLVSV